MSLDQATFEEFEPAAPEVAVDLPPAAYHLAPDTTAEAARMLDAASGERVPVLLWGSGRHQGLGHPVDPEVVISTARLDRVLAWEPDDLTLVAEAGVPVGRIEEMLAEKGQTAALPETTPDATVGGVVAAGVSGFRRARFGPTRDRILEVTIVTGDGREVKGGGRVVKNVSGYDLPRLATGSLGSLGLIASVCLKLWPLPEAQITVQVADAASAWRSLYRPLAVLETGEGAWAFLQGTRPEVEAQAGRVADSWEEGLAWPELPQGLVEWSLRVPPGSTAAAVSRLPAGWRFVAEHGVGHVAAAADHFEPEAAAELRAWAEEKGGALVLTKADRSVYDRFDPWGTAPPGLDLQRRLIAGFDPVRVVNPGRLPGGI